MKLLAIAFFRLLFFAGLLYFALGILFFSDAPIRHCDDDPRSRWHLKMSPSPTPSAGGLKPFEVPAAATAYCGKGGRLHSEAGFIASRWWELLLIPVFGLGMLSGAFAQWLKSDGQ